MTTLAVELAGVDVTNRVRFGTLSIHDVAGPTPNTAQIEFDTAAPTAGPSLRVLRTDVSPEKVLFAGQIEELGDSYEEVAEEALRIWPATAIDRTRQANKRRPFGMWTNVSGTTIVLTIVAAYAPDCTTNHVELGLPNISINLDGSQDFITCLAAIAKACGANPPKIDYTRDIWLFITDTFADPPDPVDSEHPPLNDPPPTFSVDYSQVRTRLFGKGYGSTMLSDAAAGDDTLVIADGTLYQAGGGMVIAGTQPAAAQTEILTYAGVGRRFVPPLISQVVRTPSSAINWERVLWVDELQVFVAIAGTASAFAVATSPDGVTWTTRTPSTNKAWQGLAWSPALTLLVAVAATGEIMTSQDGVTWTTRTSPEANNWTGVCWSEALNLFVMVANVGTHRVQTSPDGVTWTSQTAAAASRWQDVIWASELALFVACSFDSTLMTSPDGTTWTSQTIPAGAYQGLTWSAELSLLVAVGGFTTPIGYVATSPDGVTWTSRTPANNNNWKRVLWVAELGAFIACSSDGAGVSGRRVMSSKDGIAWSDHDTPSVGAWWSIAWASSFGTLVFVGVSGSTASIMTSTVAHYDTLTGVTGVTRAIAAGSTVAIWVQRDDIPAQTALGLLELDDHGDPTDGIREDTFFDGRFGEDLLIAACDALLDKLSRPIVSAAYSTFDDKSASGRTVSIDLTVGFYDPEFYDTSFYDDEPWGSQGDFTILSVDVTFDDDLETRFAVRASSVSFTLTDLMRRAVIAL